MKKDYYSNIKQQLNVDNLELMFAYISHYKNLKGCSLNLNAKYKFNYIKNRNTLEICDNEDYINLYDKTINLKIICGENGAGKSW